MPFPRAASPRVALGGLGSGRMASQTPENGVNGNQGGATSLIRPDPSHGRDLWRIARDSGTLDLNSPYAYLLWCRDFADTSVVALGDDGRPCGFVTGYLRPARPDTLFVWQIAVDAPYRGRGLARRMLDELASDREYVEATIAPGNAASTGLFESFARDHGRALTRCPLFDEELFPDGHEPEVLFRLGPRPRPVGRPHEGPAPS